MAAAAAAAPVWLLQQLPPHKNSLPSKNSHPSSACPPSPLCKKKSAAPGRGKLLLCTCAAASSSSSSSVVTKGQEAAVADDASEPAFLNYKDDPNFRGCRGCGRDELERGCNGEGRIQGGIAAVPGFGWWPIKAYRPCPGFVASGGRYRRQGQSMDDVASGRGKKPKNKSGK